MGAGRQIQPQIISLVFERFAPGDGTGPRNPWERNTMVRWNRCRLITRASPATVAALQSLAVASRTSAVIAVHCFNT